MAQNLGNKLDCECDGEVIPMTINVDGELKKLGICRECAVVKEY